LTLRALASKQIEAQDAAFERGRWPTKAGGFSDKNDEFTLYNTQHKRF
jgi:hypothetical protein